MGMSKGALARALGMSPAALYAVPKQLRKDWALKGRIERLLREHPGYGYRRVALALRINKKRAQRVMRLFGIKAYRRRGRRFKRARFTLTKAYPNLLLGACPSAPSQAWVSDFSRLLWNGRILYLATVMDLFTREIVGWALQNRHGVPLVLHALFGGLLHRSRPGIFHSDNGREYDARVLTGLLTGLGVAISRSHPGCPWENGYQEAFYSHFKLDLGDPSRFPTLGELVAEVHRLIYAYNTSRIHSALRMAPRTFRERSETRRPLRVPEVVEKFSNDWGS
jgi:transposase InsO family protein